MALANLIENNIFKFTAEDREEVIHFIFPLGNKASKKDIHYIKAGCGCTSAYFSDELNAIVGELRLIEATSPGQEKVTKTVSVFFDSDVPELIASDSLEAIKNTDKRIQYLSIRGSINQSNIKE
jgi:hypothetical protein